MKPNGWRKEPNRHALAAKGIKTRVDPVTRRMDKGIAPLKQVRDNYEKLSLTQSNGMVTTYQKNQRLPKKN